jgi:DNA (cytosine-5)-methyltransferase 1
VSALPVVTSSPSSYPALLDAAWQQHLAPRAPDAPTVISTFAGCGGSSLGYSMAGYRELLAVEWDNNAVQTFSLNFPDVPVYHGDIAALSVDEVLQRTGLQSGELDVFDGSPPCQGFSTAGKRVMDDPRNQLFREYARLLRGLRPKVFVMENVSGMVKGKMKLIFADILRELKASGYKVSARLLNAMYFHVPQSRERMIFIGVRDDLTVEPSHPRAQSKPVTVRSAVVNAVNRTFAPFNKRFADVAPLIPPGKNASNALSLQQMRELYPALEDKIRRHSFENRMRRTLPNEPHPTVSKQFIACDANNYIHYEEHRYFSGEELRRIASFPDAFQMTGTYQDWVARIGNSVPPLLMRAIASHIRTHILERATDA